MSVSRFARRLARPITTAAKSAVKATRPATLMSTGRRLVTATGEGVCAAASRVATAAKAHPWGTTVPLGVSGGLFAYGATRAATDAITIPKDARLEDIDPRVIRQFLIAKTVDSVLAKKRGYEAAETPESLSEYDQAVRQALEEAGVSLDRPTGWRFTALEDSKAYVLPSASQAIFLTYNAAQAFCKLSPAIGRLVDALQMGGDISGLYTDVRNLINQVSTAEGGHEYVELANEMLFTGLIATGDAALLIKALPFVPETVAKKIGDVILPKIFASIMIPYLTIGGPAFLRSIMDRIKAKKSPTVTAFIADQLKLDEIDTSLSDKQIQKEIISRVTSFRKKVGYNVADRLLTTFGRELKGEEIAPETLEADKKLVITAISKKLKYRATNVAIAILSIGATKFTGKPFYAANCIPALLSLFMMRLPEDRLIPDSPASVEVEIEKD
jgi:hypothetical protein